MINQHQQSLGTLKFTFSLLALYTAILYNYTQVSKYSISCDLQMTFNIICNMLQ